MRRLGIRFGDNDFSTTCTWFLRLILPEPPVWEVAPRSVTFTRAQVVTLFNETALGIYLMKQNRFEYDMEPAEVEHIRAYLRITEDQVYIDDEVGAYVEGNQEMLNGEFFAVDFDLGYVWSA